MNVGRNVRKEMLKCERCFVSVSNEQPLCNCAWIGVATV